MPESDAALSGFLNVELDLAATLLDTATTYIATGNLQAADKSLDNAAIALDTVHRFAPRLPSEEETTFLSDRATGLQQKVQTVRGKVKDENTRVGLERFMPLA